MFCVFGSITTPPLGEPSDRSPLPAQVASFLAYDSAFRGGVYVATAGAGKYAVSSDGSRYIGPAAKVVTGLGAGVAPVAKVFDGAGRLAGAHYGAPATLHKDVEATITRALSTR